MNLSAPPTWVLGITERSGTNFVWDLLRIHPAYAVPAPVYEDDLLAEARLLERYADQLAERWTRFEGAAPADHASSEVLQAVGDGLLRMLAALARRAPVNPPDASRLLTKTPSFANVDLFPRLFPTAHLLLLVRDGRAVVESAMVGFAWPFDDTARLWARRARELRAFLHRHPDAGLVVRYEDVWRDVEGQIGRILDYVGLDVSDYDFDAARALPVRGSSVVRPAGQEVHWAPVQAPAQFDPTARWRDWDLRRLERFEWLAGDELDAFGYERVSPPVRARARSRNVALDVAGTARRLPGSIRRRFGGSRRP